MRKEFKGRINLNEKASEALRFMVNELKDEYPHVQLNPSKLCDWIVEHFVRNHFDKESQRIAQEHFNSRHYLQELLRTAKTEAEIKEALNKATNMVRTKGLEPKVKRKVKQPDISLEDDSFQNN